MLQRNEDVNLVVDILVHHHNNSTNFFF